MDEMLAVIESRCSMDGEAEAAFKFLTEWIEVSIEMGLDPVYRKKVAKEIQEVLF